MRRQRIVTVRTVRKVWLTAAAAAAWLLATAAPALAQPIVGAFTVQDLVGVAFKWARWAVVLIAAFAVFNVWKTAAMKKDGTGTGTFKSIGTIIAGAALVFYFFTNAGVQLLRTAGDAAKETGVVEKVADKDEIKLDGT